MAKDTGHDPVDIAGEDLGRVADRLSAAQLQIGGTEIERISSELPHPYFERNPGPGRRFFKDHGQGLPLEQRMFLATQVLEFQQFGSLEDLFHLLPVRS